MAQEYLPCFLQECHFRRRRRIAAEQAAAPVKSEDDVNLLIIFALCISRQMKLIHRGRNVTLSKVLTSKSKYLHRCAGSCLLLGIAACLEQFMPAWSRIRSRSPSAPPAAAQPPAALREASCPGRGAAEREIGAEREKGSAAARMPRRCDGGGRLGYLCRRDVFCSPILEESHF